MNTIRRFARVVVYGLVVAASYLWSRVYKIKNYRKKRLLIYTDSRGFEITRILNRRNPFSSYVGHFIRHYNVDYYISPRRHTTTLDFLALYERISRRRRYDFVILHTGIVDFSPRPRSSLAGVFRVKEKLYRKYFDPQAIAAHLDSTFDGIYEGEPTNNLYSPAMAEAGILPLLKGIDGLIWISCNRVLKYWEGNYRRGRPGNMDRIDGYNTLFLNTLKNCVDLSGWEDEAIMRYTCDNIHLTETGMAYLRDRLVERIA